MLDKAIEKKLGKRINFKRDVILQDDGNGVYIKEWNLPDTQPTMEELITTYNNNQNTLELDARIRLNSDLKLIRIDGSLMVSTGYLDTIDITNAQWEEWRSYVNTLPVLPVRLQIDSPDLPAMAQDGALDFVTRYIENVSSVNLSAEASTWIFKNNTSHINAYLPNAENCVNRVYYLKNNNTFNKSVYVYPISGQKIDNSVSMTLGSGKNSTIISIRDSVGLCSWVILENP